jgi:phosphate-selective porin OprO/OprP
MPPLNFPTIVRSTLAVAGLLVGAAHLKADARDDDIAALREQIRQLDQKLRVLERKQEIKADDAAAAAKSAAKVTVNDKGVTLASGDGANVLRLRGLVQGDSRWFFGSDINNNDAFLIRRARLIFEGTFSKIFQYQLVPEFGGTSGNGTLTLLDANITVALRPEFQIKVGRFREPVGLEQLQSDAVAFFAERSVVSQFVPNRDIGIQLGGDLAGGTVSYALGVFNGVPDGTNNANNTDLNNKKEFAARVFLQPFKNDRDSAFAGLGFGVGGSIGRQNGVSGTLTSGYKTDGQQTFFKYRTAVATDPTTSDTVAKGTVSRVSPQAYYYVGPFGLEAEYVISKADVLNGTVARSLKNKAWQVSAGYVLTGEDAGYTGVVPKTTLSLDSGTWGAFEVVGRVSGADIDDGAFTGGSNSPASKNNSATGLTSYDLGLNWYLSKTVRASFDYFHTTFDLAPGATPAKTAVIARDENALVTRLQLVF